MGIVVVFIIIFVNIDELFCRCVLTRFILVIVVFLVILFRWLGYKRRWILPRKVDTALAAARPSMACDWIPVIIDISRPDR